MRDLIVSYQSLRCPIVWKMTWLSATLAEFKDTFLCSLLHETFTFLKVIKKEESRKKGKKHMEGK